MAHKIRVSVPLTRRRVIPGGFVTETIGERSALVAVHIDESKLAQYAKRALNNTTGRCRAANGLVTFVVDKRSETRHIKN